MKKINLLLLLIWSCFYLHAQNSGWTNYTSTKEITCTQKSGDILWVGTTGGLVKYNTVTLQKEYFNCSNSGLKYNNIIALHLDGSGNIWVSNTGIGHHELSRFDGTEWTSFAQQDTILAHGVYSIKHDASGNIWFLTYEGLVMYDGSNWTEYTESDTDIPFGSVTDMDIDSDGLLWFSTEGHGLISFNGFEVDYYIYSNNETAAMRCVRCVEGNVWVVLNWSPDYTGAAYWNGQSWVEFYETQTHIYFAWDYFMAVDSNGNLWLASDSRISLYNGTTWTLQNNPDFGNDYYTTLTSLYVDEDDIVWLGTDSKGLYNLTNENWSSADFSPTRIKSNDITALDIDNQQNAWIGTSRGLSHFDGTNWFDDNIADNALMGDEIKAIVTDSTNVWAETSGLWGVVCKYDGVNWSVCDIQFEPSLANIQLFCMAIDLQDNIWVGFYGGLAKYNGQSWVFYNHANSPVPSYVIEHMCVDSDGSLWLDFTNNLVNLVGNSWIRYNTSNSGLPTNRFNTMGTDSFGNVWIGCIGNSGNTAETCLAKYDGTNWTLFQQEDGDIPFDNITAITKDNLGNMWFGTDDGLMKYDGTGWSVYHLNNSINYSEEITALACDNQNRIWVGTRFNGVYLFDVTLSHAEDNTLTPDISIQVFPNPVYSSANIKVDLAKTGETSVSIYNIKGQKVADIANSALHKGLHEFNWNGCGDNGSKVGNGVYFVRINNGGISKTTKCLLLR